MKHLSFVQAIDPLLGGGLGASALNTSNELSVQQPGSLLVTSRGPAEEVSLDDVLTFPRAWPQKAFYSTSMFELIRTAVADSEVVHGHGFYTALNAVTGHYARKFQRPLVYHTHGILDPWILARSRVKKKIAHLLFEDKNYNYASFWRALTDKEANQIRNFGIKAPIVVIPNGAPIWSDEEIEEFRCAGLLKYPKTRKRMVFVGRLHPKKGLPMLIKAYDQLRTQLKEWEIAIYGPDELNHRSELEELIKQLGLENDVLLFGPIGGDDKHAAFCSSDLFVLPSHSEGLPMAVIEAASYGLPVLQTTECNFPELSEVGGAYLCLPTVDSIRNILEELVHDSNSVLAERGLRGRQLVEGRYSWKQVATQLHQACVEHCKCL